MKNNTLYTLSIAFLALLALIFVRCKQDALVGAKTAETGKVYFPDDDSERNGIVAGLQNYSIDTADNTIAFPVTIYRGGFSDFSAFTVSVEADNSSIAGLIQSGVLPANTIALDAADYEISASDTIAYINGIMKGFITPKIKVANLNKYGGKYAALGIVAKSSDKFSVNNSMNKVVIYFPVDSIVGKINFPDDKQGNNTPVSVISNYIFDTAANTVNFPVSIMRGGIADLSPFTVNVDVDNSAIAGLISSGSLPSNTVILSPNDYMIDQTTTLTQSNGTMQGSILPKIKVAAIEQYSGKIAALGLKLSGSSKFSIDSNMNTVIIYFNVDDLLNIVAPRVNLLQFSKWTLVNLSNSNDVQLTLNNADSSMLFTGGNGGYNQMGIYQAVQVKANLTYTVDMNVQGSGATNVWFEVWVSSKQPQNGTDVTASWDPTAKTLLGINTWDGCGASAFNGLLSQVQCEVGSNVGKITFPTAGTYYITIKSGGNDLGTTGIKAWNIYFK